MSVSNLGPWVLVVIDTLSLWSPSDLTQKQLLCLCHGGGASTACPSTKDVKRQDKLLTLLVILTAAMLLFFRRMFFISFFLVHRHVHNSEFSVPEQLI